ncbi:MAG TPA: hypothetical protein VGE38_08975 [Nocardioides sp.]|uniref:hypothetical protein n=1 Tax=Nocardioides sp. TaxID=35761 RepID=UPI002ED8CD34
MSSTPQLGSRLEIAKLAQALGRQPAELSYLATVPAHAIRDLRQRLTTALYARNNVRFQRIASLTRMVPTGVSATIAEKSLGPMLSARVAAMLEPDDAVRLARALEPDFVAELAASLDPGRMAPIVARMPDDLIVDVGRRLLRRKEYVTVGRLVPIVAMEPMLAVIELVGGYEILQVALYVDNPADLERIVDVLPDEKLRAVIESAALAAELDEAVMLIDALSPQAIARIIGHVVEQDPAVRDLFVRTVHRLGAWETVLTGLALLPADVLPALVNLPVTLDPELMTAVITTARKLELGAWLMLLLITLDDEHADALATVDVLQDPDMVSWLTESVGASRRITRAILRDLGAAAS